MRLSIDVIHRVEAIDWGGVGDFEIVAIGFIGANFDANATEIGFFVGENALPGIAGGVEVRARAHDRTSAGLASQFFSTIEAVGFVQHEFERSQIVFELDIAVSYLARSALVELVL